MNERIKQLWTQAGDEIEAEYEDESRRNRRLYNEIFLPKFAELIVKECMQACINEGKTFEVESAGEYSSNLYATAIKKHFGVEE
jgi:hypothetical protein